MERTRTEDKTLQGKTYQELSLTQHLPHYKKLHPSTNQQTRTMASFIYFVLYQQLTGKQKSQMGCSEEFKCQTTPFKHLVTGKKQPGGQGEGKSSRTIEDIQKLEGEPTAEKPKVPLKPKCRRGRGSRNK